MVLFCKAFNEKAESAELREENAFRRTDTEYLLYADRILIRLQTNDAQAIHTCILTAEADAVGDLRKAAENAFSALSDPLRETPPQSFLLEIAVGEADVLQAETMHFVYLLFRSPDGVTVQQINRHLCALPSRPAVRSSSSRSPSADNA